MKNYYKKGIMADVDYTPTRYEEANSGLAMIWRGMSRGENHRDLYKSGITGACIGMDLMPYASEQPLEVVHVGKVSFWERPMESFTGFLVDVAHLLLMIGGLYLVAGAIWGTPGRR